MLQLATASQAEKNLARWQARLTEAQRQHRQLLAEAQRLSGEGIQKRVEQAAAQVERFASFVSQAEQELQQAQPISFEVPAQQVEQPMGWLVRLMNRVRVIFAK